MCRAALASRLRWWRKANGEHLREPKQDTRLGRRTRLAARQSGFGRRRFSLVFKVFSAAHPLRNRLRNKRLRTTRSSGLRKGERIREPQTLPMDGRRRWVYN
jgi:hypothetical protein